MKKIINNVLVATDFSESSKFAILRAAEIAKENKSKLTILHIAKKGFLEKIAEEIIPAAGKILVTPEEYAASILKKQVDKLSRYKIKIHSNIITGEHPAKKILKYVKQHKIDFLVVGAHGKYSIHDWFVGTTAEYAARKTTCPILIIKNNSKKKYKKILLPIDFSFASKCAFQLAIKLFPKNNFHIFHVGDHEYEYLIKKENNLIKNKIKKLRAALTFMFVDKLKKFVKNSNVRPHSISYDIKLGYPGMTILEEAKSKKYDLVVMGTKGHAEQHYLFIGRVASRVLIEIDRDILLVPPEK